ncbi:MAG: hypothetical protein QM703_12870 [Gemmatales bacterium]
MQQPSATARFLFTKVVLGCYFAFAIVITLHDLLALVSSDYRQFAGTLTPMVGWVPSMWYAPSIIFIGTPTIHRLKTILGFMVLAIVFGLIDSCQGLSEITGNPYIDHHPYRYWFTIGLPIMWASLVIACLVIEQSRRPSDEVKAQ